MKIGFFDSGLGGLIMLKAVARELPQYDYEFYGDTANVPYGDKTEEEIFTLTRAGIVHLFDRGCAMVIIACNTASAETARQLQDTLLVGEYADRRILGVIVPTVEEVLAGGSRVAYLVATKRTVTSGKYEREFAKHENQPKLIAAAESRLVPLIEAGDEAAAADILSEHLTAAATAGCDTFILGCTHYALLKDQARQEGGEGLTVVSQDEIIPRKLTDYLARHPEMEMRLTRGGTRNIFLTDTDTTYDAVIAHILGGTFIGE